MEDFFSFRYIQSIHWFACRRHGRHVRAGTGPRPGAVESRCPGGLDRPHAAAGRASGTSKPPGAHRDCRRRFRERRYPSYCVADRRRRAGRARCLDKQRRRTSARHRSCCWVTPRSASTWNGHSPPTCSGRSCLTKAVLGAIGVSPRCGGKRRGGAECLQRIAARSTPTRTGARTARQQGRGMRI